MTQMQHETLAPEEIRRRVATYAWYHTVDLGHGVVTPGEYDLAPLLEHYGLPASLAGQHVLDVGPGHGFFAFEFERRGGEVFTAELPNWMEHDASPELRTHFDTVGSLADDYHHGALGFAIQARQSTVRRQFCNVYDLSAERVGTYDFVFCASVLLHLTDPLRALYGLRRVCRHHAIVSTGVDSTPETAGQPRALFIGTVGGQAFWLPTVACLQQMMQAAGFVRTEVVSEFVLTSRDGRFATPHATVRGFVA